MASTLTDDTARTLNAYLREVKNTRSEIGKRERFIALLGSLFPSTREVGRYAQRSEKSLRIQLADGAKRGSADTLYGSAVLEFEKDLKRTGAEAEHQLREYAAGIWQAEPSARCALDAVATDGVCWRLYRPVLPEGMALTPDSIVLELRREILLSDETLGDLYRWLDLFLFRQGQVEPTSENIRFDFAPRTGYASASRPRCCPPLAGKACWTKAAVRAAFCARLSTTTPGKTPPVPSTTGSVPCWRMYRASTSTRSRSPSREPTTCSRSGRW